MCEIPFRFQNRNSKRIAVFPPNLADMDKKASGIWDMGVESVIFARKTRRRPYIPIWSPIIINIFDMSGHLNLY